MLRSLHIALAITSSLAGLCQAFEGLLVERYHEQVIDGDSMTTYRIFADLADGYTLQMVFGSEHHPMRIESTSSFFNDTLHGERYADRVLSSELSTGFTALDSWITVGAASSAHAGVPLDRDDDGSVLHSKAYRKSELAKRDGLIAAEVKPVVDFRMNPGYLRNIKGSVLLCMNCAWSVLGGISGPTAENMVLLAQITTAGELAYELNLQIGKPGGGFIRYVAKDPADDEVVHRDLLRVPSRLQREASGE